MVPGYQGTRVPVSGGAPGPGLRAASGSDLVRAQLSPQEERPPSKSPKPKDRRGLGTELRSFALHLAGPPQIMGFLGRVFCFTGLSWGLRFRALGRFGLFACPCIVSGELCVSKNNKELTVAIIKAQYGHNRAGSEWF